MIHSGPPIVVSLANEPVSFGCRITHPYAPELQDVRVHYYRVDLQGHRSSEKQTGCQLNPGKENQTSTQECRVTLKLPNSSATGTYYCSISWAGSRVKGNGTFILVRGEASSVPPPQLKGPEVSCSRVWGIGSTVGDVCLIFQLWRNRTEHPQEAPGHAGVPRRPPLCGKAHLSGSASGHL